MIQNFKQFMYCNESSAKNHPSEISAASLIDGSIFSGYTITQLGVQGPPGTKFYLNGNANPVIIGFTGIFSLDLRAGGSITALTFDSKSVEEVQRNDSVFLIIDIAYLGE